VSTQKTFSEDATRVMLVDDQAMTRLRLAEMLKGNDDLVLVGEVADGEPAILLCGEIMPDVVLMDMLMPGMDGVTATRAIRHLYPTVRVIVVSGLDSKKEVVEALKAGATGYLLKTVTAEELAVAIRLVTAGLEVVSPQILKTLMRGATSQVHSNSDPLTEREKEVLALMIEGFSNQKIAQQLVVDPATVKSHVSNILSKLHVTSRTEAVSLTLRKQLIP
jgi:NarL family two-component system response regulator LiaR